jgi:hypothetical protein
MVGRKHIVFGEKPTIQEKAAFTQSQSASVCWIIKRHWMKEQRANQARQPTPGVRLAGYRASLARRGCAFRWPARSGP